jgi:hypothetical protein
MNGPRRDDRYADPTGLGPANAIRKVVVVAAVLVRGPRLVTMGLRVGGVSLMNEAHALEQTMRRRWRPYGSQNQRSDYPDSTHLA